MTSLEAHEAKVPLPIGHHVLRIAEHALDHVAVVAKNKLASNPLGVAISLDNAFNPKSLV